MKIRNAGLGIASLQVVSPSNYRKHSISPKIRPNKTTCNATCFQSKLGLDLGKSTTKVIKFENRYTRDLDVLDQVTRIFQVRPVFQGQLTKWSQPYVISHRHRVIRYSEKTPALGRSHRVLKAK
ncbi:unnamed protein product [Acidithrix sp. C25]|nr:unnamed protein product [Acidithrix sp. C25]